MQYNAAPPMTRDEFLSTIHKVDLVERDWVYAWLLGYFMADVTDETRGAAWADVEAIMAGVKRMTSIRPPLSGSSPLGG